MDQTPDHPTDSLQLSFAALIDTLPRDAPGDALRKEIAEQIEKWRSYPGTGQRNAMSPSLRHGRPSAIHAVRRRSG